MPAANGAPGTDSALLRMAGIGKRFGATQVLDGVSLDIGDSEFVCLLGPSGCGKTTLLKILCGIERCDTGTVWLDGEDITQATPGERQFGVVFQSYALFPNLTALDNVSYGLERVKRAWRHERAMAMLDLVGMGGYANRYPAQLSGGQQQRVALARALAPQPRVLLLDEPLSALDAQVRHSLRHEIRRVQRELRVPTVMVTHDQDEALAIADRVVLMNQGRIEQASLPADMYASPASEFAARFIGRMNLWRAKAGAGGMAAVGQASLQLARLGTLPDSFWLGIRPEQVRLHAFDHSLARAPHPPPPSPNTYAANVADATFCGAYISLLLEVPELGGGLRAELPTPHDGRNPWGIGSPCMVQLAADALHVIAS